MRNHHLAWPMIIDVELVLFYLQGNLILEGKIVYVTKNLKIDYLLLKLRFIAVRETVLYGNVPKNKIRFKHFISLYFLVAFHLWCQSKKNMTRI